MARLFLALVALSLASWACNQPVPGSATVSPTQILTATPTARPTATASPAPSEDGETAIVRQPVVRVRGAAGGLPTGEYVTAGQSVTILGFDETGDWAQIENPPGWVWAGCLEGVNKKGCEANP